MRKGMLGLVMALVMLAGVVEAVQLPPEGEDFADSDFTLELNLQEDGIATQSMTIDCSGPTIIKRSDPVERENIITINTQLIIPEPIPCTDGIKIRLIESTGHINVDTSLLKDDFFADSFFDVFFEIEIPNKQAGAGLESLKLRNQQPVRLEGKIVHIPPFSSPHFSNLIVPIILASQSTDITATLNRFRYHVKRPIKAESRGEVSPVFSCFYECKQQRVSRNPNWLELTTLMLVNQSRYDLTARILFFNGNEKLIGTTTTRLSPQDLDEINVCETLNKPQAGQVAAVPSAGVIEVVLGFLTPTGTFFPHGGAYGWVKNINGKFKKSVAEPFDGTVTGIAKTECRLVGPNVITPQELLKKLNPPPPTVIPILEPILIEGTRD